MFENTGLPGVTYNGHSNLSTDCYSLAGNL